MAIKTRLLTGAALFTLAMTGVANAQQMQMLPPTYAGSSSVCAGSNSLLFFGGAQGNDPAGKPISAINCLSANAPTIDPVSGNLSIPASTLLSGDLWLGSKSFWGNAWYSWIGTAWIPVAPAPGATPEVGPALHFSTSFGVDTDDFYFQRHDIAMNQSVLRLVIGDDASAAFYPTPAPGYIGDAFQIGAIDSGNGWAWTPRFTFTSNGLLGIGTTSPMRHLDIENPQISAEVVLGVTNALADYRKWNLVVDAPNAAPGIGTEFYLRQLNDAGTGGNIPFLVKNNDYVGISSSNPQGNLDIEPTPEQSSHVDASGTSAPLPASLCLNGTCETHIKPTLASTENIAASTANPAQAGACTNGQANSLCTTAVSVSPHDLCTLTASETTGTNNNCIVTGIPGQLWTLQAQRLTGQTNCLMSCYDFQ
jgi:hypothetical protein